MDSATSTLKTLQSDYQQAIKKMQQELQSAMEKAETENKNTLNKFDKVSDLKVEQIKQMMAQYETLTFKIADTHQMFTTKVVEVDRVTGGFKDKLKSYKKLIQDAQDTASGAKQDVATSVEKLEAEMLAKLGRLETDTALKVKVLDGDLRTKADKLEVEKLEVEMKKTFGKLDGDMKSAFAKLERQSIQKVGKLEEDLEIKFEKISGELKELSKLETVTHDIEIMQDRQQAVCEYVGMDSNKLESILSDIVRLERVQNALRLDIEERVQDRLDSKFSQVKQERLKDIEWSDYIHNM